MISEHIGSEVAVNVLNKITRKGKVLECLRVLSEEHIRLHNNIDFGYDTEFIAEKLSINRSNASKELNELLKEETVLKIKGKPVGYLHKASVEKFLGIKIKATVFENIGDIIELRKSNGISNSNSSSNSRVEKAEKQDEVFNLIGARGSLKLPIEQAKAAVIYPPKGLNTLIIGPTGVGKSIFAEYMYKYSIQCKGEGKETPFIIFNCADYSDNQQLLLAQLFGYIKGAFTGADKDKYGLVHEANNGILFLDEVHRLSAEGQEMLFLLMDKGIYRRLGEVNKVHECKVMIIAATTEAPETAMLATFLRRIPVLIKIPALEERGIEERMKLVFHFFKEESKRIGVIVNVSKEVIKAFMLYECKGNIGQLKSDIQLICARAFLDYMTLKKDEVYVKLSLLPTNIRECLYLSDKREALIGKFNLLGSDDITFQPDNEDIPSENLLLVSKKYDLDFYEIIKETWNSLKNKGIKDPEIRETIDQDIQKYSYNLMNTFVYNSSDKTIYDKIINDSIFHMVKNVISKYDKWNEKENFDKLIIAITLHVQNLIERIKVGNVISHPSKDEVLKERQYEYKIAREISEGVSKFCGIDVPVDEELLLATFLYLVSSNKKDENVAILVIMHGETTASSMANVANNLLNCDHAKALDMDLKDKVQDILLKAVELAPVINKGKGILILTDMGSILTFEKTIEDITGIPVRVIDMVSTPIVIEATRKALSLDMNLDTLCNEIKNSMEKHYNQNEELFKNEDNNRYFDTLLIDNISKTLTFLNAEKAYKILKEVISKIGERYKLYISDDMMVKFVFHCCCMIERAILKNYLTYKFYEERISRSRELYITIKNYFKLVEDIFDLSISDMEYASILDIFEQQYGTDAFKI